MGRLKAPQRPMGSGQARTDESKGGVTDERADEGTVPLARIRWTAVESPGMVR
jgi:hypothetical protein